MTTREHNRTWRRHKRPIGRIRGLAALWGVCLLAGAGSPVGMLQAETITSRVFVSIVGNASAVNAVTNLQVGLTDAAPEATTGSVGTDVTSEATASESLPATTDGPGLPAGSFDLGSATSLPGSFAVVGESGQVFSVQLPQQVVLDLGGELVQLTGFQHDGGVTPSAGDDGVLEIRFSADVNRDQASALQNLVPASGTRIDESEIVILQVAPPQAGEPTAAGAETTEGPTTIATSTPEGTPLAGPTRIAVRVADPFALPKNNERQVVIVISFN